MRRRVCGDRCSAARLLRRQEMVPSAEREKGRVWVFPKEFPVGNSGRANSAELRSTGQNLPYEPHSFLTSLQAAGANTGYSAGPPVVAKVLPTSVFPILFRM